jgi:hypothetical protein
MNRIPLAVSLALFPVAAFAQAPAAQPPTRPTASVNTQPRVDVLGMPRPIEMHDSVWIENLTMMEVRDLIKAGKTTAVIGIHEKMEGLHDDYYISALIAVHDLNGVRLPERIKAGKTTINGVDLAPAARTIENGKKIAAFRAEKTIAAVKKAIAASR